MENGSVADPRSHFDRKNLCHRCLTGIDDDKDGDCAFCHRLSDEEAANMRRLVLLSTIDAIQGKQ
jgi:hypothetical protein